MKRILVSAAGAAVVFGAVWALASTLNVSDGTAATGTGDIAKCGDVTGSTYILEGQATTITGPDTAGEVGSDGVSDIDQFFAVNIETVADCNNINVAVEVHNEENGEGGVIAAGTCQVNLTDGLGYDESGTGDNVPGCTAFVGIDNPELDDDLPMVAEAQSLVVTMT